MYRITGQPRSPYSSRKARAPNQYFWVELWCIDTQFLFWKGTTLSIFSNLIFVCKFDHYVSDYRTATIPVPIPQSARSEPVFPGGIVVYRHLISSLERCNSVDFFKFDFCLQIWPLCIGLQDSHDPCTHPAKHVRAEPVFPGGIVVYRHSVSFLER